MKTLPIIAITLGCIAFPHLQAQLCTANVIPEATNVYNYLKSNAGLKTFTGHHDDADDFYSRGLPNNYTTENVLKPISGRYPAIHGHDFGPHGSDRQGIVDFAKTWWAAGGIPTLCWHESYPTSTADAWSNTNLTANSDPNIRSTTLNDAWFHRVVTPGTTEYNALIADLDKVAAYLKQLRDAHVPVLWRPYHENNGGWFWWGHRPAADFKALWQIEYNRYTTYHGLNNLIWVWCETGDKNNASLIPSATYYPGDAYVDVIGADVYQSGTGTNWDPPSGSTTYNAVVYNALLGISTAGKLIAMTECGDIPSPAMLAQQPKWCYFMTWDDGILTGENTNSAIYSAYNSGQTIDRDETGGAQLRYEKYETESLVASNYSDTENNFQWTSFSGGWGTFLGANAVNDTIWFKIPDVVIGSYSVRVGVKRSYNRGTCQLAISRADDPTNAGAQGAPMDLYNNGDQFLEFDLGIKTFSSSSDKLFQMKVTGKNASNNVPSPAYTLAFDYITLIQQ